MRQFILFGYTMCILVIAGCAGSSEQFRLCAESGEIVQIRLNDVMYSNMEDAGKNLSVSVATFEDNRPPSKHLGSHKCQLAGDAYFQLKDQNLGQGMSDAFVDFLKKSAFQVAPPSDEAVDIGITGKITRFTAKATRDFFSTTAQIDIILEFTIENKADDSTIHMIIRAGGTNDVVFFNPEDMEKFVNEIIQISFEKFLKRTEVKGKTLRQKI